MGEKVAYSTTNGVKSNFQDTYRSSKSKKKSMNEVDPNLSCDQGIRSKLLNYARNSNSCATRNVSADGSEIKAVSSRQRSDDEGSQVYPNGLK